MSLISALLTTRVISYTNLKEHYGESVSWGGLEDAVAFESLTASLTGELGKNWRAAEGDTFRERIRHIISDPIEKLRMKLMSRYAVGK